MLFRADESIKDYEEIGYEAPILVMGDDEEDEDVEPEGREEGTDQVEGEPTVIQRTPRRIVPCRGGSTMIGRTYLRSGFASSLLVRGEEHGLRYNDRRISDLEILEALNPPMVQ